MALTKIKLNKYNRKELRELLNEGVYIDRVQAVDWFNHIERGRELKFTKLKMDASEYFDYFFMDSDATLYRDSKGRLYTDDIKVVDFEYKQKTEIEQTNKSINKYKKNLAKAQERAEQFNKSKIDAENELSEAKKEYDKQRQKLSRSRKKGNVSEKLKKEEQIAKKRFNRAKVNIDNINNKIKINNDNIKELKDNIESWSNKENKIYTDKDVKSTEEMRELAIGSGLQYKKEVYSKELKKDLDNIEREYKSQNNKKKLQYEDRIAIDKKKKELIDSRQDEIFEHIEIFERCPVTSSATRQGKTIFVKNKVIVEGEVLKEGINDRIMNKVTFGAYDKAKITEDIVDIVSLDTVASLPQSSRIGYAKEFNYKKGILVLPEVNCEVENNVARVYLDKNGKPDVEYIDKADGGKDINKLFDGQAFADKSIMNNPNKPTMLLREKGFKANAINTNVQEALKDRYKLKFGTLEGYEEFKVKDIWGNELYAKDIKMITTDSAMKIYKLADLNHDGDKSAQHREWLDNIDGFSVVKNGGKHSKYGDNQRASYQIANTINFGETKEKAEKNMKEFVKTSIEEVNLMKESNEHYLDYLKRKSAQYNNKDKDVAPNMFDIELEILKRNKNYANTQAFKDNKSRILSNLKADIKEGKFLLEGDNLQVVGNPIAMLDHAMGFLPVIKKNGEVYLDKTKYANEFGKDKDVVNVYTKRFANGEKLVHARSPHSNEASFVLSENVCDLSNKDNKFEKYFNVDDTVCFIDGTNHASQAALGGQDYDSDINLVTNDKTLYKVVEENSWGKTYTTVNDVPNSKAKYKFNAKDRAYKDVVGSKSGIGEVANLTQTVQSQLTNAKYTGASKEVIEQMERDLHLLTNATNISIDNVKKPSELALFDTLTREGIEKVIEKKRELEKIDGQYRMLSKEMKQLKEDNKELIAAKKRSYKEVMNDEDIELYNKYKDEISEVSNKYSDLTTILKEKKVSELSENEVEKYIEYRNKIKDIKEKHSEIIKIYSDARKEVKLNKDELIAYEKYMTKYKKLKTKRDKLNKSGLTKEINEIRKDPKYNKKGLLSEIQGRDYYIKNNGKMVKPDFFTNVSQNAGVKTKKMNCNMDMLADIVEDEIKFASKGKSTNLDDILVKTETKYDNRRIEKTLSKISDADKTINGYRMLIREMSEDEAKTYYEMIEDVQKELKSQLKKIKLTKEDMKQIIRRVNGLTKDKVSSSMRSTVLTALFHKDKDTFIDCFEEGDSLLPYSETISKLADESMDNSHGIVTNIITELNDEQDKLTKKLSKQLNETMTDNELNNLLEKFDEDIDKFTNEANKKLTEAFRGIIMDAYGRTLYNQCKVLSINIVFNKMSEKRLNIILTSPFADNVYDKRMINNMNKYGELIRQAIADGYKEGKSRWLIVKELEEVTDYSKKALDRLVRTETTNFSNRATMEGYREAGIDKYIYLATLDSRTSSLCRELDGKVFEREKAEIGVNMPPMHPYCRSTTIAYYNDDVLKKMKRRARGKDGKNYVLDSFMTYEEWTKTNIQ